MAAYLHRAQSGGIGHRRYFKGYDCGPYKEKQRGTVLGSETIFLVSCHMTYKPPQADSPESYDHVCTLQSCHGAVVAPLSDVPQEGSSVFSLVSLVKLHLASLRLASSYSRVAVSSAFWTQNIYFSAQTRGAPLNSILLIECHYFWQPEFLRLSRFFRSDAWTVGVFFVDPMLLPIMQTLPTVVVAKSRFNRVVC